MVFCKCIKTNSRVVMTANQIKRIAIEFHKWMKQNDTVENAEQFFHYTDEDMFNEFIKDTMSKATQELHLMYMESLARQKQMYLHDN